MILCVRVCLCTCVVTVYACVDTTCVDMIFVGISNHARENNICPYCSAILYSISKVEKGKQIRKLFCFLIISRSEVGVWNKAINFEQIGLEKNKFRYHWYEICSVFSIDWFSWLLCLANKYTVICKDISDFRRLFLFTK